MTRLPFLVACAALLLAGCAPQPVRPPCPPCPGVEPRPPAAAPLQPAVWSDLPGWRENDPAPAWEGFLASCRSLEKKIDAQGAALWQPACVAARRIEDKRPESLRGWFEANFRPWALVNPDGSHEGLVTGYYEPVLQGSRKKTARAPYPVFGPPADLIVVDLAELYPELKSMRLRGRLEGRRLIPYYSRADWSKEESKRLHEAILWVSDPLDFFFMQIQGSGQVELDDGSRVRLGYADQNGHPYRSIGRWLIEKGELESGQASMQGIRRWAENHPERLAELLNANPSLVFFRELPVEGSGPPGALGVPLTPRRSLAVDPRHVPLGAPVWLATTWPSSEQALTQLMLAQDTGGAIRGVVRADFYWGSGPEAGALAGKMRQSGRMWVVLPKEYVPARAPD
ncbi:MAG: MltA domain-containing protein [Rugosibacter sp.]|nr:MltA domain-containing protein [Rugosibacter sp.]